MSRPIMPPTVVTQTLGGSGPKQRPTRARCSSSCPATTPAWTRTTSAPVATIRRRWLEQSITTPGPRASPQRLEPAPRGWTGTPFSAAQRTVAATSDVERGRTTASGQISKRLASVAYRARLAGSHSTSPSTTPRRSSAIRCRWRSMVCRGPRAGGIRTASRRLRWAGAPSAPAAPPFAGAARGSPGRSHRSGRRHRLPGSGPRTGSRPGSRAR